MRFVEEKDTVDKDVLVGCFLKVLVRSGDINAATYHNAVEELKKEKRYGNCKQEIEGRD